MISYEQALKYILDNTHTLPAKKVLIDESIGRILKEDINSRIEMPPFNKSMMDGYAVNHLDVQKLPIKLRCLGLIQAGERFDKKISRGECVKIMTGAPLPENTDTVVIVEHSKQAGEYVELLKTGKIGDNVSLKGEDLKRGQKIFNKNERIGCSDVGALATAGWNFVKAVPKPTVSILNTGGELVSAGAKLGRNKIYNSIGPMLKALLGLDGIKPRVLGIAKDNRAELREAIKRGLNADILLISGGVSVGDYDLVPDVLMSLGAKKIFHKINLKPGKPLFFGTKNQTLIFGIPGNPVPNFLAYFIFIRPAIYKMMGYKDYQPVFKEGILETELHTKAGRRQFVPVKISQKKNVYYLSTVKSHGSADTLALSLADGFMVVDENLDFVKKNTRLQFITWKTL